MAGRGWVWRGKAGQARRGLARRGAARPGEARQDKARFLSSQKERRLDMKDADERLQSEFNHSMKESLKSPPRPIWRPVVSYQATCEDDHDLVPLFSGGYQRATHPGCP